MTNALASTSNPPAFRRAPTLRVATTAARRALVEIFPDDARDLETLERELREDLALGEHESWMITLDERPIGFLQSYNAGRASGDWWLDEDTSTRGIDLFIGDESLIGRGIGPAIVRAWVEKVFVDETVTSIIVDPHPDNARSIRCFEKAGFVDEGVLETPDGLALLMRLRRGAR
jgi:aminoglycoside 6'-N-acetyltransferase-1b/aminoglycoside 6'-N-acetyltransferase-2